MSVVKKVEATGKSNGKNGYDCHPASGLYPLDQVEWILGALNDRTLRIRDSSGSLTEEPKVKKLLSALVKNRIISQAPVPLERIKHSLLSGAWRIDTGRGGTKVDQRFAHEMLSGGILNAVRGV